MKKLPSIIAFTLLSFGVGALVVSAQNYAPLAPLPGTVTGAVGSETTNLSLYVAGMIKLLIALGSGLAVLYAIIGGTQYVAASINPSAKGAALEKVQGALIGLAIILTSYLLLNSINPDLVNFRLDKILPSVSRGAISTPLTVVSGGGAGQATQQQISSPESCGTITPVSAILNTPESQQMEAGAKVIFTSSDPAVQAKLNSLKTEVDKLKNSLAQVGASATVNSAYRPYAYQKHLYEIYYAWKKQTTPLETNIRPECLTIKNIVEKEYSDHQLGGTVGNPDNKTTPHMLGIAVDLTITGIPYDQVDKVATDAGINLRWKPYPGDQWHFELK